jgi:hypothetical protein
MKEKRALHKADVHILGLGPPHANQIAVDPQNGNVSESNPWSTKSNARIAPLYDYLPPDLRQSGRLHNIWAICTHEIPLDLSQQQGLLSGQEWPYPPVHQQL